jgi:hypothetical protein
MITLDELEKLLAAATPGPWTHASDKLAAGNIKAPDNAALIVAAVNALPELLARVKRLEEALRLGKIVMDMLEEHGPSIVPHLLDTDENAGQRFRDALARAALEQTP